MAMVQCNLQRDTERTVVVWAREEKSKDIKIVFKYLICCTKEEKDELFSKSAGQEEGGLLCSKRKDKAFVARYFSAGVDALGRPLSGLV